MINRASLVTVSLLAALTAVLATAVRSDAYDTDPAALAGWYAAAWALFAGAAWTLRRVPARCVVPLVLTGAVAMAVTGLLAEPRTSTDSYRYAWDGRVQAAGMSPYDHAPADPALRPLRDRWLFPEGAAECARPGRARIPAGDPGSSACTRINRPSVHTIYPPVAEGYFLLVHQLSPPGARHKPLQTGGALLAVGTSGLLLYALRRRGGGRERWAAYWAWCPAVPVEAVNNAHVDALGALLTAAAFAVLARRPASGGALLGAGIATKLLPAVTLPGALSGTLRKGHRRRGAVVLLAAAGVVGLGYLPYVLVSHSSVFGYLGGYTEEEGYDDASARNRYALLRLVLPDTWALPAALVVLAVAAGRVLWRGDPERPWRGALVVTGTAFLLLTPGYSWYALLLVVLVALDGRWEWLGVAVAGAAKYVGGRAVGDPNLLGTVAYGVAAGVVVAMWLVRRFPRRVRGVTA
ncbi:glycosyltransferase 87 family protein [Streptomyces morookaense]|uniref:glycosyltransferase 87 family protein n=1 Tax=Streptomyces morookaense TaxID=1970 RepID=UPI001E43F6F7|nr:glycosyltransferase 87 family protein [Streptomyces morookaense]